MIPTTQTVFRVTDTTTEDFKGLKSIKEEIPKLEKNEILIKIKAVTLNFRDILVANGNYPGLKNDQDVIPGCDGAGDVVQVGSNVRDFQVGDRIITCYNPSNLYGKIESDCSFGAHIDGVMSEYKVVTSNDIVKLPKNSHLSYEEAASLVCAGITAYNSIFGGSQPFFAGQSVLMLGTGGVSLAALIFAKAAGAVTIITSSSDEKIKQLKEEYGVDHGINYRTHPDWEKEVLALTNGEGADFVVETGGSGTIEKSLDSLAQYGHVGLIGFLAPHPEKVPDVMMKITVKAANIRYIQTGSRQLYERAIKLIHAKKLHFPIGETYGFSEEQVRLAYQKLASQTNVGKIAIKIE